MSLHALFIAAALVAASPEPVGHMPVPLSFEQFFTPTRRGLEPSPRLRSLQGKRIRLVGFMAKMEFAPAGAFYLTPQPVVCDEAGGGTADLPPTAVYVIVRSLTGEVVPFTPRSLEVTGVLDLGHRVESDGRATFLRLTLDRLEGSPPTADGLGASPTTTADAARSSRTQEKP